MSGKAKAQGMGVAEAIGALKWIFIALVITVAALSVLGTALSGSMPAGVVAVLAVGVLVVTALLCLTVWVVYGWLEYTLQNLVQIERNTRPRGTEWVTPGSEVDAQMRRAPSGM